jgi:hypothetical protein
MRLLYCNACRTIDEVPDYEGSDKVDPLVEEVVRKHNVKDPMTHGGGQYSPMRLMKIDDLEWMVDREKVVKLINESNKQVGMDPWVGESHNTFLEDANKCWRQHRQPKEGEPCIDYWSESKRIGRPTAEGRAALKENYKLGTKDPHLCLWCPYHVVVTTEVRHRRGMYKENGSP